MKKRLFLLMITFIFSVNVLAETAEEFFDNALDFHKIKNYKLAEENYKKSYALKQDYDTAYNLAVLYKTIKNNMEAEKYFKEAIRLGKKSAYYELANLYSNIGRENEAIKNYELSIKETKNIDAMYNLGLIYMNKNDTTNAIKYFQMAVNAGDIESNGMLANLYLQINNVKMAEYYNNKAIQNKVKGLSNYDLSIMYEKKRDYVNAIKYLEKDLAQNGISKTTKGTYFMLGTYYENVNNIEKAIENYSKAISQEHDINAAENLIDIYQKQNNEIKINEVIAKFPDIKNIEQIYYNLGIAFDKKNNKVQAEKYYMMAIEKGNNLNAMNNLAILYYEKNNLDEALKWYRKLVDEFKQIDKAFNIGLIYSQQKKYTEALKYFEIAYKQKNDKRALYHLGIINYDLGNKDLGIKYLKQATQNGDKDAKLMLEGI